MKREQLTDDELRELLMQRKIRSREARVSAYRASGRVIDADNAPINDDLIYNTETQRIERVSGGRTIRRIDIILLIIEIAAVIAVVILIGRGSSILRNLNEEASRAFSVPTVTPTALIQAVVLPGGHTAPDAVGNAVFNENEIPEHLRGLVSVRATPVVPVDSSAGRIIRIGIPAINVDAPVVQGDDWEALKTGVGLNAESGLPGKPGNVILSGHNDIFGQVFRELDRLKTGDEIMILTEKNAYTYLVTGTQIVQPSQVEVMRQTEDSTLTLISCYPYLVDTQRIVVSASLKQ
ncbi:MAG: class D sortase [Anaerolineaceae bacterium]|nr:class D sortase [Anaerolineaceae bacterium]